MFLPGESQGQGSLVGCYLWGRTELDTTEVTQQQQQQQVLQRGFPGGSVVKNPLANAGNTRDVDLIPGLGRSPGGANGNILQYSRWENSMDREAWWATVHRVAKLDSN